MVVGFFLNYVRIGKTANNFVTEPKIDQVFALKSKFKFYRNFSFD